MVVQKNKRLKKKAIENDYGQSRLCSICKKSIARYEVESGNFEYCKSKLGEHFAHTKCVNNMIKNK